MIRVGEAGGNTSGRVDKFQLIQLIAICGGEEDAANEEGEVEARERANEAESTSTNGWEVAQRREDRSCKQQRHHDPLRQAQDR